MAEIFRSGCSRIPVYESSRDDIVGLLFAKDLIFIDPEDGVPIKIFLAVFGRTVQVHQLAMSAGVARAVGRS